jgi:hypothetical protein
MDDANIRQEINKYKKFKKVDGATYRKVNQFLRKRTYITAREWALARLCTDFRTSGGAEMTFIGKNLPELVPFMEETYTPQAVNQARNSFKKKVRKASATFFYGAMCGFFTTDELDDLLFEASEVARFLLEVEGTTLDIDEEIDIEDRITKVMRSVGEAAKTILKTRSEENDTCDHPPNPESDMADIKKASTERTAVYPADSALVPLENTEFSIDGVGNNAIDKTQSHRLSTHSIFLRTDQEHTSIPENEEKPVLSKGRDDDNSQKLSTKARRNNP